MGRGREEGRERVARVRALIMRRLQPIVDGQTLCVPRANQIQKKKVDEVLCEKKNNSRSDFVCKEHPSKKKRRHKL